MTDAKQQPVLPEPTITLPKMEEAWRLLTELVRIRKVNAQKFVSYDQQRTIKREERIAWEQAEQLIDPKPKAVDPVDRSIASRKKLVRK